MAEIRAEVLGVGLHHLVVVIKQLAEHQVLVEEAGEYINKFSFVCSDVC